MQNSLASQKQSAALEAVKLIENNMVVGLGTGSTAAFFIAALANRIKTEALHIQCVPTSLQTRDHAQSLGINLVKENDVPQIDITIDGADELDSQLNLIKGGGGALLREKIVAQASHKFVIIADHTKKVDVLGHFPLPIEIIPFGMDATQRALQKIFETLAVPYKCHLRVNNDGNVFRTDSGNYIFDASLQSIVDPQLLNFKLNEIVGVVEHGLFLDLASLAFIAYPDRVVQIDK